MERMKKIIAILLTMMVFSTLLEGCEKRTDEGDRISFHYLNMIDWNYKHLVNQPASCFAERVERWEDEHPNIFLSRHETSTLSDIPALARLGVSHLPDVFMADCQTGHLLAKNGLVLDLTDYLNDEESGLLDTFSYDGRIYAFPAMMESYSIVVYDPLIWQETGCESFPLSWKELTNAAARLKNMGYEPVIGTRRKDSSSSNDALLSLVLSDEPGADWFAHMRAEDREAAFTDTLFTERLDLVMQMLESNVFSGQDQIKEGIIDAFADGKCPAAMVTGIDVSRLLEKTRDKNPELYARVEFASLPWLGQEEETEACIPSACPYGLFINVNLKDQPEKLLACIQMCRDLKYDGQKTSEEDRTLAKLSSFTKSAETCSMCTQYLSASLWSLANQDCFKELGTASAQEYNVGDDEKTAREYAAGFQDSYDEYCLEAKDYSKLVKEYT